MRQHGIVRRQIRITALTPVTGLRVGDVVNVYNTVKGCMGSIWSSL